MYGRDRKVCANGQQTDSGRSSLGNGLFIYQESRGLLNNRQMNALSLATSKRPADGGGGKMKKTGQLISWPEAGEPRDGADVHRPSWIGKWCSRRTRGCTQSSCVVIIWGVPFLCSVLLGPTVMDQKGKVVDPSDCIQYSRMQDQIPRVLQ